MSVLTYEKVKSCTETYEIADNVIEIGINCFKNCRNTLKRFYFQSNPQLKIIKDGAFYGCKLLEEIDLSKCINLKQIESSAFSHCSNVTSLKLPEGLEKIGFAAFADNPKLTNISLPSTVTTLSALLFIRCEQLTTFNIDKNSSLQTIDYSAFSNTKISYLFFPKNLSLVSGLGINEITLDIDPENPHLYYKDGIVYCNKYKTIGWCNLNIIVNLTLGDEIDVIEQYAFYKCKSLKYINIESIITIKDDAFYKCISLISLNIRSVYEIGRMSFAECRSLTSVIMASVNIIGDDSFYPCTRIQYLSFSNVTYIGTTPFIFCYSIITITDFKSSNYQVRNNMLIDLKKDTVLQYALSNPAKEIEINCSKINSFAFRYSKYLEKIIFKNTTSINHYSFYSCKSLKTLIVPKTLNYLNPNAFDSTYPTCVVVEGNDEDIKNKLLAAQIPESSILTKCPVVETKHFKVLWHRVLPFKAMIFISLSTLRI